MHPALWQLLWFEFRGAARRILDVRKNWKQLALTVLMLLFVGMFLSARSLTGAAAAGRFGSAMPFWAYIYLIATWLTASADRRLVMRPAEINFIVAGPFRQRDTITLNLIRLGFRALIGSAVLSLIALAYVDNYLCGLAGIWLMISVSLLAGMLASLSSRRAQASIVKRLRRMFTVLALGALLLMISQAMAAVAETGLPPRVSTVAGAAIETQVGRIVLAPLAWMFAPMAAERFFFDAVLQMPARIGVIGCLIAGIYFLGSRFSEASTNRTDQSLARRQTALRSGVTGGGAANSWTRRVRVPILARIGGIGSVAWVQMTHAVRILPRYLLFTSAIVGVVLILPLMVDSQRLRGATSVIGWMTGLTLYADFLLLLQLPVGFLGPISQREMLKSLPMPSWRIVVGQLAGPLLPIAPVHLSIVGLFVYLVPAQWMTVLAVGSALLPAGLVITANINLLGMWGIIRPKVLQQRDALAAGRAMASVWVFFAMLIPAIIAATVGSMLFGFATRESFTGYLLGAAVGTLLSSGLYIALLARSFQRWQPVSYMAGAEEVEHDQ